MRKGKYSEAYQAHILETARAMEYPSVPSVLIAAGPDEHGRTPSPNYVWRVLKMGGVELLPKGHHYPAHIRAAAMELVIGEGLSPSVARKRMVREMGTAPSRDIIAGWCGILPQSLRPVTAGEAGEDDPGDSWERAWNAAEGLDGAAWADAVMRSWLPEDRTTPSEPDVRVLSTRRRAA